MGQKLSALIKGEKEGKLEKVGNHMIKRRVTKNNRKENKTNRKENKEEEEQGKEVEKMGR